MRKVWGQFFTLRVSPPSPTVAWFSHALWGGLSGVGVATEWFSLPQQVQHPRLIHQLPASALHQ
eukprot:5615328-Pyramimonas_sp.AAC.1